MFSNTINKKHIEELLERNPGTTLSQVKSIEPYNICENDIITFNGVRFYKVVPSCTKEIRTQCSKCALYILKDFNAQNCMLIKCIENSNNYYLEEVL